MEAPSDSDMGFTPTVRHSNIEDDSLLPPLTIPPTAVRVRIMVDVVLYSSRFITLNSSTQDEPTRPPVDKSMPATSQLPTQSRSQNRAALRNSPKQQLLVAPAADGLQGVIDSGKCIVCESKPAACFFNKTSAGHTEEVHSPVYIAFLFNGNRCVMRRACVHCCRLCCHPTAFHPLASLPSQS